MLIWYNDHMRKLKPNMPVAARIMTVWAKVKTWPQGFKKIGATVPAIVAGVVLLAPLTLLAQPMTTPNYRLDPNVANSFGGLSTTGNYGLVDSGGEAAIGFGSSGSYKLSSGYVSQLQQSIELNVLPSGLVAYYPFNTGTGIQAYDVTPNSNQGVLTSGPTWAAGKVGSGALEFDGTDDFVEVKTPNSIDNISSVTTWAAWVRPGDVTKDQMFLSKQSANYLRIRSDSKPFLSFNIGGAQQTLSGNQVLSNNNWYHLLATYDGSEMRIFVNGALDNRKNASGALNFNSGDFEIGRYSSADPRAFVGRIDEVKIYDRALSEDEVQDEYNASNSGIASALTLPKITAGASQTVDAEAVVITDAGGYDLSIEQDKDLTRVGGTETIPAIAASISNPDLWNEGTTTGLGFTVTSGVQVEAKWGTDPNFEYAAIPGTSTTFHSRIGLSGGAKEITGLRFRLGIDGSQTAGMYTNRVGFTATLKP